MFLKFKGSTKYEVRSYAEIEGQEFVFNCYLPPLGYGINSVTLELEKTDVVKRSLKKSEQYWERTDYPADYLKRKRVEQLEQEKQKKLGETITFFDPVCSKFEEQEWRRRLCGYWYYNNGVPTYITGMHYLYLNWWKFDGKFLDFRLYDLEFFYVWDYCVQDENCLGLNYITKRKSGKCFGIDTPIRMYDGSVKKVQDIVEGDFVMGNDSKKRIVSGVTNGREQLYRINQNIGNGFVCNKSHIISLIWNGVTKNKQHGWEKDSIVNISVEKYLTLKKWEKEHLPMYNSGWGNSFKKNKHKIPPYIFGLFLGDGDSDGRRITSNDHEIVKEIELFCKENNLRVVKSGKYGYNIVNEVNSERIRVIENDKELCFESISQAKEHYNECKNVGSLKKTKFFRKHKVIIENTFNKYNFYYQSLRELNVIKNKHIPSEYLIDDFENRIELLAGLIDTDGHLCKTKGLSVGYEIIQKNENLANNILELSRSLGFTTTLRKKLATMKRTDGSVYSCIVSRIRISGDIYKIPCRISRKKAENHKKRRTLNRFGFSIEPIGVGDYYGFAVDSNHLFLLEDGTVVHNSAKSGIVVYEPTSRTHNVHSGIQSKGDEDSEEVFQKCIITPWKRLPDFFRPIYDTTQGDSPKKELRFFKPSLRGKRALESRYLDDDGNKDLESWIDFKSSNVDAYDGPELFRYLSDESSKLKKFSIVDRHNTVVPCCEIDGVYKGKILHTTTIEKDEKDKGDEGFSGTDYKKLIDMSNPMKRNKIGRTVSGLYTLFLPAYKTMFIDRYGIPNEDKAKEYYLENRAALAGNSKQLASYIRKNPFTLREAFDIGNDNCHFNALSLKNQHADISWATNEMLSRGNFVWVDGLPFTKVKWVDDANGRWLLPKNFVLPSNETTVENNYGIFLPKNRIEFIMGCDPFQNRTSEERKGSKGASHTYCRFYKGASNAEDFSNSFVSQYLERPKMISIFFDDMAKQCFAFGGKIIVERNKDGGLIDYFIRNGLEAFLYKIPGEKDYGVYSSDENKVLLVNCWEEEIELRCHKIQFKELLTQLIDFDVLKTEKFDLVMSSGWTLVANYYMQSKTNTKVQFVESSELLPDWFDL